MREIAVRPRRAIGLQILVAAAIAAFVVALYNNLSSSNGIHGTAGALLVVVSTGLMAGAAAALLFAGSIGHGLRVTLAVLIALDILGTGVAAYLLETNALVAAVVIALIGGIVAFVVRSGRAFAERPVSGGAG